MLKPIICYLINNKLNSVICNRFHTFYKHCFTAIYFAAVYIHFAVNLFFAEFLIEVQNIFLFVSKLFIILRNVLRLSGKNHSNVLLARTV